MKVVNMGNIADAFRFDNLPANGIVIEATPEELKLLPNLAYKDVTISGHVGNKAAMRDACANIAEYAKAASCHTDDSHLLGYLYQIERLAESAISAPPRNCDRPECATTKAAQDVWRKEDGGKTAFYEWLLATYTEGGTTDGKKH